MICILTVVESQAHSGTKTKDIKNKSLGPSEEGGCYLHQLPVLKEWHAVPELGGTLQLLELCSGLTDLCPWVPVLFFITAHTPIIGFS